jgi:uncharacterized protein (TIGR01777 family)
MRIVVAGSSGLTGSALVRSLEADGHEVTRLVRRPTTAKNEVRWEPSANRLDQEALLGADAVVSLAGAGVGDHRWTDAYKKTLRDSRLDTTATLAGTMAGMTTPPPVFLSASAVGFYGDTGDREVDERSPGGVGFLADLCRDWEAATRPAFDAGVRVCHLRTGLVVSAEGGAFGRMFPLFRFGLGGKLGSGRQFWSFVSLPDHVAAVKHVLERTEIKGAVNLTAPHPVTNAEVTRAMAHALHRPALLPAPAFALRLVLGEFAGEITGGQRVLPRVLEESGFTFAHPTVGKAVAAAVQKP